MTGKQHFLELSPLKWQQTLVAMGYPAFRGKQLVDWIFKKGVSDLSLMSNLPVDLKQRLAADFDFCLPEVVDEVNGSDGSTKLILKNREGHVIESVIMRYDGRTSLCVSSQLGCKLGCVFCQTGKLGFVADLGVHDILAQYVVASTRVKTEDRRISHVVFMGMGEPLDNYEATIAAANCLLDEAAYFLSARHVTISTAGIAPKIAGLARDTRARLAISLHAARDDLRTAIMPINKRYPLDQLKKSLKDYQASSGNKIMIEYILIKDKNCSQREAKELVQFLQGLRAKVNLIPYNTNPGLPFQRPDEATILAFQKYLVQRSIPAPVRYSQGGDVAAACGQLAAKVLGQCEKNSSHAEILTTASVPFLDDDEDDGQES